MRAHKRIVLTASLTALLLTMVVSLQTEFGIKKVVAPPSTILAVDPENVWDPAQKPPGSTFKVNITIANVVDLYSWQVYMEWTPGVFNVASFFSVVYGDFLESYWNGTHWVDRSTMAVPPNINNAAGYCVFGVLSVGEDAGVDGSGWLAEVELTVADYNCSTAINIDNPTYTKLLDSTYPEPERIPYTPQNGYFRNMGPGDTNGDGIVDIFDIGVISAHWYPGPPEGPLGYGKDADINLDGSVDIFDIGIASGNWGNLYP